MTTVVKSIAREIAMTAGTKRESDLRDKFMSQNKYIRYNKCELSSLTYISGSDLFSRGIYFMRVNLFCDKILINVIINSLYILCDSFIANPTNLSSRRNALSKNISLFFCDKNIIKSLRKKKTYLILKSDEKRALKRVK